MDDPPDIEVIRLPYQGKHPDMIQWELIHSIYYNEDIRQLSWIRLESGCYQRRKHEGQA